MSKFARGPQAARSLVPTLHARAVAVLLLTVATAATAQTSPDKADGGQLERVVVTGSSIKRIASETALPVQTVTREDIVKSGATTAAEIMTKITANVGGLTDGASVTDNSSGQRGFNSANLRGLGTSSTLVLLNGRRMANFASPGDDAGVDLNNIPAAAIQRVEVLKDGASAIYGTDAIGGVINFITRKDFNGVAVDAYAGTSQEGGAGKRTASLAGGFGNLDEQGFNVFGVLDIQKLDSLRASERDFLTDGDMVNRLPELLSSTPYPANVRLRNSTQVAQLNAGGRFNVTGSRPIVNPSAPGCNPPSSINLPDGAGGPFGCGYDYVRDALIYPESDKIGFLGRGTLKINADHQVFAEAVYSQAKTQYETSPVPLNLTNGATRIPASSVPFLAAEGVTGNVDLRMRTVEAGNRNNEVTSTGTRFVLGANGALAGWDYDAAYVYARNEATDAAVGGYFRFDAFRQGIIDGKINPFGPSSAEGQALIRSLLVNDDSRKAEGTMQGVDFKASRAVGKLQGGDLMLALGTEFRRETTEFTPSSLLLSNDIGGDRDSLGIVTLEKTRYGRSVFAAFGEMIAPITKEIEAQVALRHDNYQGIGNTTNPKVGVRWQPSPSVLLRGSFGTGFRAPSASELTRSPIFGSSSAYLTDPLCVQDGGSPSACTDQLPVTRESNPDLKPERSRQFTFGAVFEPSRQWNLSADYWAIRKRDVIGTLSEETILNNLDRYGDLVTSEFGDAIDDIKLRKANLGRQRTDGIDLAANWRGDLTSYGRFGVRANATYILNSEKQSDPQSAYVSNLGRFRVDGVVQRWRHRISADWDMGPVGLTLANTYLSGYRDHSNIPGQDPNAKVDAYSLWDLTGSYALNKDLKLRAGIQNLFDTQPPFSNQSYHFLASYDPTYTDPRGRFFYASLSYSFK